MESTWGLAIFLWSVLIIGVGALLAYEMRKTPEQKKREAQAARERWEKNRLAEKVVEVKLLDGTMTRNKRGGLSGAMTGLFFGGIVGAAVGAALPGTKKELVCSFAVKYGDGRTTIRQCAKGSSEYKAWMKCVKQ